MADQPKILVVDENTIVRDWVKGALQGTYEVLELGSALDVGAMVLREKPALLLFDEALPLLQGERIVELARESGDEGMRILLFSTLAPEKIEARVASVGADGHLPKSGDASSFRARITAFLSGETPSETASQPSPSTPPPTTGRPVMIAGSGAWSRVVSGWLAGRFRVVSATSAAEVRAGIQVQKPALVVLGEDLPDATVEAVCSTIRREDNLRRTSVLYIGGPGDAGRAELVRDAGANLTLLRPLEEATFFAAVNSLGHVAVRRDSRLLVRIEVQLSAGAAFHVGFTSNLSSSGVLIESDYDAELDALIGVRFFLPGRTEEIAAEARVVRIQERTIGKVSFGAIFVALEPGERVAIEGFVAGRR